MSRIDTKTTGMLIDEYTIAKIKEEKGINGGKARKRQLTEALRQRLTILVDAFSKDIHSFIYPDLQELFDELAKINRICWNAQDIVMDQDKSDFIVALAAREAQQANASRNNLIRQIDKLLGEDDNTYLEKNYQAFKGG